MGRSALGGHGVDLAPQITDLVGEEHRGVILGGGVDEDAVAIEEPPFDGTRHWPPASAQDGVDVGPEVLARFHGGRLFPGVNPGRR